LTGIAIASEGITRRQWAFLVPSLLHFVSGARGATPVARPAWEVCRYSPLLIERARKAALAGQRPVVAYEPLGNAVSADAISPSMFGAKGDGTADDTEAVQRALVEAARSGRALVLTGTYRITAPLRVEVDRPFTMLGAKGRPAGLAIDHVEPHPRGDCLDIMGRPGAAAPVLLHGFFLGRATEPPFNGARLLKVSNVSGLTMDQLELYRSSGFSFLAQNVSGAMVSRCYVHDNLSGSQHRSGTDGLHFYEACRDVLAYDNRVERVGDDALSFGSYSGMKPNVGAVVVGNQVTDVAGSIKVYGAARDIVIAKNSVTRGLNGGVTLWDDRNEGQSFDITDVSILSNVLTECGGPAVSAGIYLMMSTGNGRGQMRRITIRNNVCRECKMGISLASFAPHKRFWDVVLDGNQIIQPKAGTAVFVKGVAGDVTLSNNRFTGTRGKPVQITNVESGRVTEKGTVSL
jgi:polygalacturonase